MKSGFRDKKQLEQLSVINRDPNSISHSFRDIAPRNRKIVVYDHPRSVTSPHVQFRRHTSQSTLSRHLATFPRIPQPFCHNALMLQTDN